MLVNLQGRRVSYDLLGAEDAPVVCFAHSLASDGGMWAEQVEAVLAAGFRVLRADMRGHGGSAPAEPPYTMDALADDLVALLDALALERVHLVGLSIGGMLAQSLAIRNPAKLASLLLCDTQPSAPPSARGAWSAPLAMVRQADSLAPVRSGLLKAWFTDAFKTQRAARWQQIHDTLMGTSVAGFEGCVAAMSEFDYTASLGSVRVPTLVVYGADDPMTPPAENQRLAASIPGARAEAIAGAKHFPNVEQAEAFNRILRDWLEANRSHAF
ncbi:MAG TPA: alpha/beta fold hydrolase [Candidatus Limnocylindria bacterium]|jgi:3-oxoadipate enol-lactonase|nr:alpha/beta fold hydrolase [Candidatus Limnocylindria bacterium]